MYKIGQRWISEAEPELGLGTILKIDNREVHILFGASQTTRVYSPGECTSEKSVFRAGDKVKDNEEAEFKILRC